MTLMKVHYQRQFICEIVKIILAHKVEKIVNEDTE